jgi:hypothetical protein
LQGFSMKKPASPKFLTWCVPWETLKTPTKNRKMATEWCVWGGLPPHNRQTLNAAAMYVNGVGAEVTLALRPLDDLLCSPVLLIRQ